MIIKMRTYEDQKEDIRRREREMRAKTQEIAPLPPVVNPRRKKKALASFRVFCETYFADVFYLKWSKIHLDVIDKIERVIRNGEIYALAMPRGSGKSSLFSLAVIWAGLQGLAEFIVLIASNSNRAENILKDMKTWLETNELLLEDFPEVCYPIRKLERIAQRQRGQIYNGVPTRIDWKANVMVFPTIEGSAASGVCITTAGMNGSDIRGLARTRPDGKKVRPSLVLIDDPQTRESAQSEAQCAYREKIIKSDILGMAGPGKKLACCIAMTVVAENDVAQRLLDRTKNPEFRGERYQLLEAEPTNIALWDEYRQIREAELKNDGDGSKATAFYREHKKEMDAGAVPTWEDRFNDDEISAVQHAMNLKFRDLEAFLSEYQNMPARDDADGEYFDVGHVAAVSNRFPIGYIPDTSQFLTAFVDVHKNLLFWCLCAWEMNFNGVVVNYGTYPKQRRSYFQLSDASPTLTTTFRGVSLETAIYKGLKELIEGLFNESYMREDGADIPLQRVLIDANWGPMADLVYQFISESPFRARITPSHGLYIGASSKPFSEFTPKKGDMVGAHWRIPNEAARRSLRRVLVDTNYWKSFILARLKAGEGDIGRLTLDGAPEKHTLFASHLASEFCVPTHARGRRVDEWKERSNRPDNHWLDCLVGCAVGASISGAKLPDGQDVKIKRTRKVATFSDIKSFAKRVK